MISDIQIGDIVAVEGEPRRYRVDGKNRKTGMLVLEALNSTIRIVLTDVHEFQVSKVGAF